MYKIKEYIIVRAHSSELAGKVNEKIEEGWQPYGHLAISDHKNSHYAILFQPMVKYGKD